jgi:hypothetical protein
MSEIKHLVFITSNPTGGRDDRGSAEHAWFTVSGDAVTLVTRGGEPLRGVMGDRITAHVAKNEKAPTVAQRLAIRDWQSGRDETADAFNRPIRYPRSGWL